MKFDEIITRVPPYGVFRTGQILSGQTSPASVVRQMDRWCKADRLIQLRRGVYALPERYVRQSPHPFLVSNILKRASYVSLQSALAHYGMIPEYVPTTTGVTTGRPEHFDTALGRFQYRHVSMRLFSGFRELEIAPGQPILIAGPEKALIDLLYLTPGSDNNAFLRELRLSPHASFSDPAGLMAATEASSSKKVGRAVKRLQVMWREEMI